ncbi:PLP-dependent transferase [Acephala macrosclerotiorum]|nr:PLP-dependent transferase [Acephala macrosclerotiorum]
MEDGYNSNVEAFREAEYPMLQDAIYLDHAGTTLYAKSLMEKFATDMISNLYGNPHSASASSQLSTNRIEDIRLKVLRFFNADPEDFDLVFVANATAGIKLVMDAFRESDGGFNYGYHKDSHTSLVGVRENASSSRCLDDEVVDQWLSGQQSLVEESHSDVGLFAYPAQSNMDGRRLPLSWSKRVREMSTTNRVTYTLLDASAFVSTSALDLSDASTAPDFTVLSFYKIFGFPDLGALIVRKESGAILQGRKYFGGGTVDVVLCNKEQWHAPKSQTLHDRLEDGTLAIHSILALDAALEVHWKLYGSMDQVARHTTFLARKLFDGLSQLRHGNGEPVCVIHSTSFLSKYAAQMQGPIVAFNLKNSHGAWISNTEFERLASVRKFHIRSGGLCNPGGVAACLELEPWEMRNNFSAGFRCGAETDIYAGKVTGVIRASLGSMSTISDVQAFVSFVREFYDEATVPDIVEHLSSNTTPNNQLFVESLTIYPIKSCGGFIIPPGTDWEVRPEGLAWDREWCLVHQGTGQALSQKRHPHLALIRPSLDFAKGILRIEFHESKPSLPRRGIAVPLSADPSFYTSIDGGKSLPSRVCGDAIVAQIYVEQEVTSFFSDLLGVPCTLARFPAGGSGFSTRHSKAHMQKHQRPKKSSNDELHVPGAFAPLTPPDSDSEPRKRPILLSNESPILAINRASLDALNAEIVRSGGKPASASVFRANIVLGTSDDPQPYSEDHWSSLWIGKQNFEMLGSCRRCHMICIDQDTAQKNEEPFVTLAKTRRFDSKIFFGSHMCHIPTKSATKDSQYPTIRVGDIVKVGVTDGG